MRRQRETLCRRRSRVLRGATVRREFVLGAGTCCERALPTERRAAKTRRGRRECEAVAEERVQTVGTASTRRSTAMSSNTPRSLRSGQEAPRIENTIRIELFFERTHMLDRRLGVRPTRRAARGSGWSPAITSACRFFVVERVVEHFDFRPERVRIEIAHAKNHVAVHDVDQMRRSAIRNEPRLPAMRIAARGIVGSKAGRYVIERSPTHAMYASTTRSNDSRAPASTMRVSGTPARPIAARRSRVPRSTDSCCPRAARKGVPRLRPRRRSPESARPKRRQRDRSRRCAVAERAWTRALGKAHVKTARTSAAAPF